MGLENASIGRDSRDVSFLYYEILANLVAQILNSNLTLPDVYKDRKIRMAIIVVIMYADVCQGKKFEEKFYESLLLKDYYELLYIMFEKLKEIGLVHPYKQIHTTQ